MPRDDASVIDIYNRITKILKYAEGFTAEMLAEDEMRLEAILYDFIVIGEATKRLSAEFRAAHPEIPWKDMAGMRDILAHQYDKVDVNLLRRSISESLPEALQKIVPLLPPRES